MKIAVIDNYDSFTYNLVHLVNSLNDTPVDVYRNDMPDTGRLEEYEGLILSPGPGIPGEAGLLNNIIKEYAARKSLFGVCLGMQAIAEVFGGKLLNLPGVYHGVETEIRAVQPPHRIFKDLPATFVAGRYHSWIVQNEGLPANIEVTAVDEDNNIMALTHKEYDVCGVQFHPESIMTPSGKKILANWMNIELNKD